MNYFQKEIEIFGNSKNNKFFKFNKNAQITRIYDQELTNQKIIEFHENKQERIFYYINHESIKIHDKYLFNSELFGIHKINESFTEITYFCKKGMKNMTNNEIDNVIERLQVIQEENLEKTKTNILTILDQNTDNFYEQWKKEVLFIEIDLKNKNYHIYLDPNGYWNKEL